MSCFPKGREKRNHGLFVTFQPIFESSRFDYLHNIKLIMHIQTHNQQTSRFQPLPKVKTMAESQEDIPENKYSQHIIILLNHHRSMKDYFKYLTIGEINDQIRDTFTSAKQKLNRITNPIINTPSFVNDKFYNYVSQIKNKQLKYDSLMNQSQQLKVLLNQRRKRINESLQKYERSKRCKTLESFNYHLYVSTSSFQPKEPEYRSQIKFDNLATIPSRKVETDCKQSKQKYQTQSKKENHNIKCQSQVLKENKTIQQKPQKIHTQPLQNSKESEHKKLRSITKVINISIDNNVNNEKLFSFAKNTMKTQLNPNQNANSEMPKKKIVFQTTPTEILENVEPSKCQANLKQKKIIHKLLNVQQRGAKRIRERLKENELKGLKQFQKQKKQQTTKMLILKHQYQNLLKSDLKTKIMSAQQTYKKLKQNKQAQS